MHLLVVSLNYKIAPVEIRERFSFSPEELGEAMKSLKGERSILENVIISTCNRTEIYAVVDAIGPGRHYIKSFLAKWFSMPAEEFSPYLTFFEEEGMIDHLFRVTCGLHSMVVGETQILGQVRTSFLESQKNGTCGTIFNQLFKQTITLAKRAHSETSIGENAVSVSYAAVELSKKIFGALNRCHVAIIGAGKMGELAGQNLIGQGVEKITVVNRSYENAALTAAKFNGRAARLDELENVLSTTDIIISSTASKEYVVTYDLIKSLEKRRKGKPLFLVDIAVPRDIDPKISELDFAYLYDIDDLQNIVAANVAQRHEEAEKISIMIEKEIVEFKKWLSTLEIIPVLSSLRDKALVIQAETVKSIERKIPDLTDRERKIIAKHTKSIVNQLLRDPIVALKELPSEERSSEKLAYFKRVFKLEEETKVNEFRLEGETKRVGILQSVKL